MSIHLIVRLCVLIKWLPGSWFCYFHDPSRSHFNNPMSPCPSIEWRWTEEWIYSMTRTVYGPTDNYSQSCAFIRTRKWHSGPVSWEWFTRTLLFMEQSELEALELNFSYGELISNYYQEKLINFSSACHRTRNNSSLIVPLAPKMASQIISFMIIIIKILKIANYFMSFVNNNNSKKMFVEVT